MIRHLLTAIAVYIAFCGALGAETLRLGMTNYPGFAPLRSLPANWTLQYWLQQHQLSLRVEKAVDVETLGKAYIDNRIDMIAISNVDLLFLIAKNPQFPPSVAVFQTDISNGAHAILSWDGHELGQSAADAIVLQLGSAQSYLLARAFDNRWRRNARWPVARHQSSWKARREFEDQKFGLIGTSEPLVSELTSIGGVHTEFDSSDVPSEIHGMVIVKQSLLEEYAGLSRLLQEGWFGAVRQHHSTSEAPELFQTFRTRGHMYRFLRSGRLPFVTQRVKTHVMRRTKPPEQRDSLGGYGVHFPNGAVIGDPSNILLSFAVPELTFDDP